MRVWIVSEYVPKVGTMVVGIYNSERSANDCADYMTGELNIDSKVEYNIEVCVVQSHFSQPDE